MENSSNIVRIGRKDISLYVFSTLLKFSWFDEVILSARGTNIQKQENIVTLFKNVGIKEIKRENVIEDKMPTLKIFLSKGNKDVHEI